MLETRKIDFAARLLEDPYLVENFAVDIKTVENIVLYMYQWKFDKDPVYVNNQNYMMKIIALLPEDNELRIFLELEIEFAIMLSCKTNKVEYPITY